MSANPSDLLGLIRYRLDAMDDGHGKSVAMIRDAIKHVESVLAQEGDAKSSTWDAAAIISFAVDLGDGAFEFLLAWLDGDTSEWPEYTGPKNPAAPLEKDDTRLATHAVANRNVPSPIDSVLTSGHPETSASGIFRDGEAAIDFAIGIEDHFDRLNFLKAWKNGDTSAWPEFVMSKSGQSPITAPAAFAPVGDEHDTPAATWVAQGRPDPHGDRYDCTRSALIGGEMTDDEVADAIYLDPSEKTMTIAKDRIRWLSRQLVAALAAAEALPETAAAPVTEFDAPETPDLRQEIIELLDSPTVAAIANVFSLENVDVSRSFSEQIADIILQRKTDGLPHIERMNIRNAIADAMRGDDEASASHREAAALFLFWPSNKIDLAKVPERYPELVVELAKFIAQWEEKGRGSVVPAADALDEDEAIEAVARLLERRATNHHKWTDEEFEHWWTGEAVTSGRCRQMRALAAAVLVEFKIVRK